jgi:hypothetical protein
MKKIINKISLVYYCIYAATIISAVFIFLNKENVALLDSKSGLGIALTDIVILYMLLSIPLALGGFYRMAKKWRTIEDEKIKFSKYQNGAIIRLIIIGIGLIGSIIVFYLLRDISLIYCSGIAAIALIFCKPTEGKISSDLNLNENED